MKNLFPSIN